jgi:hypothetical protein
MIYRHGDVILREIRALPHFVDRISTAKSLVIAEGEQTGHHHTLTSTQNGTLISFAHRYLEFTNHYQRYPQNPRRYICLDAKSTLAHEEHKTITVEPGIYEVLIEREFDFLDSHTHHRAD